MFIYCDSTSAWTCDIGAVVWDTVWMTLGVCLMVLMVAGTCAGLLLLAKETAEALRTQQDESK